MNPDSLMIRSAHLLGTTLKDISGHKLGTVREVFFERDTGQARFVIVEMGGLLKAGGKFFPVPWRTLRFDEKSEGYLADITKDQLKGGPAYDREQLNDTAYGWSEQTERYYRVDQV
ncbi:MAG: PRC-barrel domain protein [Phenylobacterium sp.]|jgi:sporulation protein YlmC with PRC-barrel domain|nr:PRC-barrel domain protein [Phenylobacterium sp.]